LKKGNRKGFINMTVSPLGMDKNLKMLRSKSKTLTPVLNLGKNGLSETAILEIKKMLKQKKLIKIRLNIGILEDTKAKIVGKEIAAKTDSVLVDCVGHVVVLAETK
jgi:RNA-binding protein